MSHTYGVMQSNGVSKPYLIKSTVIRYSSKRPRGLRHKLPWFSRILEPCVRIRLEVLMSVIIMCIVLCVGSAFQRADPPSKESYQLCIGLRN
jgi:hypothetical protein